MAKIQSPSGETEFFQTTELQQAFEKELKTGEKVTVAPGVIEAGFLREAITRSEYMEAYQEFKDRLLNPYIPPQPPAFRCICNKAIITRTTSWDLDFGFEYDPATPDLGCYLRFKSSVVSVLAGAPNYIFDTKHPAVAFDPSGEIYWNVPFSQSTGVRASCQQGSQTIPDWITIEGFLGCEPGENLDWLTGGGIFTNSVSIDWLYGGSQNYTTPNFNLNGLPNLSGGQEIKLWDIKADLFIPAYASLPPGTSCYKNLTNIRFTNFYP